MLEMDPKKRISASKALVHPYFSSAPLICDPKQIKLLDGDSHEFFLQIQQGNKALVSKKDKLVANSSVDESKKDEEMIKGRKRRLVGQDDSTLAPSTKESCFVASIR